MLILLLLLILLLDLSCVASELSLKFVFITESREPELAGYIGSALKAAEEARPDVRLTDAIIQLDREHEEEGYRKLCSSISSGVSIVIDLTWHPWERSQQLCDDTAVPRVHTLLGDQQLLDALNSYLEVRNATDAAIIVPSEIDVDRTLYHLLGGWSVRVWTHAGLNSAAAAALRAMRPEPQFYVAMGDAMFVAETFSRAVKERLVRRPLRWNLVLTDHSTFTGAGGPMPSSVAVLRAADQCCSLLGRRGCRCPADFASKRKAYIIQALISYITEAFKRLDGDVTTLTAVSCDSPDVSGAMNATRQRLYSLFEEDTAASNDSLFYWNEDRSSLLLRAHYTLSTVDEAGAEDVASWADDEQFRVLPGAELEPLRPFYRIGTASAVPWTMPLLDPATGAPLVDDEGNPRYQGYCIDLIEKLSDLMEFDYELVTPRVGTFGQKLANGTWDGVVGDLTRGETEFAVAALTMTAEREEVIDFVAPYFEQTGILIVIRKPTRKTSLFKFMTVLRTEVWLSIVAALVLTAVMIWLLDKYSPYSARNNPEAYPYPCREFTLKESFWFALTSFTPQGGGEAPKALSGRTLVAAYWLFVVLMLATFTANLAAFLTVERMQTPVASLDQLARQSRINYTVVEASSVHQYFINMKFAEDTLYRVWKEITLNATSDQAQYRVWDYPIREQYGHILLAINASGPVTDARTGFRQVDDHIDSDFAFIHDSAEIKYEVTQNCNLTEVGEVFAEQPYAIAVQQGSRLEEQLSRALLDLQKERFLEQLSAKYWNETAKQACPDADESEGITLESLGGVFIATLFGLGLAMLTLAWEVFYYKRKERNKVQSADAHVEKPRQAFGETKKNILDVKMADKMADKMAKVRRRGKKGAKSTVTIGDTFKPVQDKATVSYINVYPKDGEYTYNP